MAKQVVKKLCREGKIPAVKIGKSWRFNVEELSGTHLQLAGSGMRFALRLSGANVELRFARRRSKNRFLFCS